MSTPLEGWRWVPVEATEDFVRVPGGGGVGVMEKRTLIEGEILQLHPEKVRNKAFAGCLFIVTEPKAFGAQGFIPGVGDDRDTPGGQFYYRANWDEMDECEGGIAPWRPM